MKVTGIFAGLGLGLGLGLAVFGSASPVRASEPVTKAEKEGMEVAAMFWADKYGQQMEPYESEGVLGAARRYCSFRNTGASLETWHKTVLRSITKVAAGDQDKTNYAIKLYGLGT
ncbi:hypothetical protein ACN4EG_25175 [Alkalinema pantanalense CENA528]|uniref:hypothetical protein n=1 Tax=Alkalinema pantanalense TaxID=1620705 RepID=UPI003D6E5484